MTTADSQFDLPHGVRLLHVVSPDDYPPAGGAFVWNTKGQGKLRWVTNATVEGYYDQDSFLMLGDVPLFQWHMKNTCPTCEQLLQAGDVPAEELKKFATAINQLTNEMNVVDCLTSLAPVVRLLPVGPYFISFDGYSPTNGEGRFYWRAFGELTPCESMRERSDYQNARLYANGNFPAFLAPTQSTTKFDQARFDSARLTFREQPGLALYLHGRLSALLDGHHRATCAAMHGERFRALTISRAHVAFHKAGFTLKAHQVSIASKEMATKQQVQVKTFTRLQNSSGEWKKLNIDAYHAKLQRVVWPELPKWVTSVIHPANYWNNEKLDAVARFSRRGVPLDQQDIETALAGNYELSADRWMIEDLLNALFTAKDPRAVPTAIRVAQSASWAFLWPTAYQHLATVRTEEVEDQFVQFLIDDDGSRPEVRAIVDRYFESPE